jgi:hypothetical protein
MRKSVRFYDDVHFQKGFNRTGFTIKEATILDNYRLIMKGLLDRSLVPNSKVETQFIQGIIDNDNVVSLFVNCWLKYSRLINEKQISHTLCGNKYL